MLTDLSGNSSTLLCTTKYAPNTNVIKEQDSRIKTVWKGLVDIFKLQNPSHETARKRPVTHSEKNINIRPRSFTEESHIDTSSSTPSSISSSITIPKLQIQKIIGLEEGIQDENYYWKSIREIGNTNLQETLTDIQRLLVLTYDKVDLREHIMKMCFNVIKEQNQHVIYSYGHPLIITLGKVLFLMEKDPHLFANIKHTTKDNFINLVEVEFEKHFKPILDGLERSYKKNQSLHLLSADVMLSHDIPLQIAKLLLTRNGTINIGLLEVAKNRFIKNQKNPINYETSLLHSLNSLQHSSKLRAIIAFARKPSTINSPSNFVIRSTLKLNYNEEITNEHARLTLLTSILAHDRQGQTNMCFAAHLAEALLSVYMLEVPAQDFSDMLLQSKLVRKINGLEVDMPFLLKLSNEVLETKCEIDIQGRLYDEDMNVIGSIWESPPLQNLSVILGFDYSADLKEIVASAFMQKNILARKQVKLGDFIDQVVKTHCLIKHQNNIGELTSKAHFVVGSLISNPLQKVWENCIAGMVESQSENYLRTSIVKSILTTLQTKIENSKGLSFETQKIFYEHFKSILIDKIHLFYDPSLPGTSMTLNTHLSDGGFVLYEKKLANQPETWLRVDNANDFQKFICHILVEADNRCKKESSQKHWNSFILSLKKYSYTDQILVDILSSYSTFVPYVESQSLDFESFRCAPWKNKIGHDANEALKIYSGLSELPPVSSIIPENACELFRRIIELGRSLTIHQKLEYEENPHKLIPMRILNSHAFGLMLGHSSLKNTWSTTMPINDLIEQYATKAKEQLPHTMMNQDWVEKTITQIKKKMNISNLKIFDKLDALSQRKWTLSTLRSEILHIYEEFDQGKVAGYYDGYIATHLPSELDKVFKNTIIHFADTNWSDDVHDIHFCFLINPCTGDTEIWEINDDNSHPMPIQNQQALIKQQWDFLADPEKLIKLKSENKVA